MADLPTRLNLSRVWIQSVIDQRIDGDGNLVTIFHAGAGHPAGKLVCRPASPLGGESPEAFRLRAVFRRGRDFEDSGEFSSLSPAP